LHIFFESFLELARLNQGNNIARMKKVAESLAVSGKSSTFAPDF